MDMWIMFQERYVAIFSFIIVITVSVLSLYATWKKRMDIPKFISVILAVITTIIISAAIYGIVLALIFGYNS